MATRYRTTIVPNKRLGYSANVLSAAAPPWLLGHQLVGDRVQMHDGHARMTQAPGCRLVTNVANNANKKTPGVPIRTAATN